MYCYRKDLPSTSTRRESLIRSRLIPGGQKSQTRKRIRVLHDREPNGRRNLCGGNLMRLDKAKDCSIQRYLDTSSEYRILVQFETRSRERIVVLPDNVASNRSLRHSTRLFA